MSKLTSERVYRFIVAYKAQNDGLSPSFRQIAAEFGTVISVVRYRVGALERAGRIQKAPNHGIIVVGGQWCAPGQKGNGHGNQS